MERGRSTLRHGSGRPGEPRAAARRGRRSGRRPRRGHGQIGGAARALGGACGVGVREVTAVARPVAVRGAGPVRGGALRAMGGAVRSRPVCVRLRCVRTGAWRMGRSPVVRAPAVPAAARDTAVPARVLAGGCVPGARCRYGWRRRTEPVHGEQTAEDDGDQHGHRTAAAYRHAHARARPRRH